MKRIYIIFGVVALTLIIVLIAFLTIPKKSAIPKEILQNAQTKVFYPDKLPDGYVIDPEKTKLVDGVLFYSFKKSNPPENEIIFSTQKAPSNFNPEREFGELDIPISLSRIGKVYDLSKDGPGSRFMIYEGSGSLLFISSEQKVDASIIYSIIDRLENIN